MAEGTKLFQPLKIGSTQLEHRVAMAPLTRFRADKDHVPTDLMVQYYAQRAVVPGTLLISEASFITLKAGGYANVPGLWSDAQLEGWKKVTDAVHAKGSKMCAQLWHLGRAAWPDYEKAPGLAKDDKFDFKHDLVSSSAVRMEDGLPTPREMTGDEICQTIEDYATAARNAIERAGFDMVEVHAAHGYLIDQFTQDTTNKREDAWGGSIEKRSRFCLEVCRAVARAVGADKVGIRLSPWNTWQSMRMRDPIPQFSYLINQLSQAEDLKLAYLHVVEPRVHCYIDVDPQNESLDFAFQAWGRERPILVAGGYTMKTAKEAVEKKYRGYDVAVVFGRRYISTPDLVYRVKKGLPLAEYDRKTFYCDHGKVDKPELGYITYPYSEEYVKEFEKPDVAIAADQGRPRGVRTHKAHH